MRTRSEAGAPNKVQKAYLQGWKHGTLNTYKKGPANQKDDALRSAYLEGWTHGKSDRVNAQMHGKVHYGSRPD